MLAGKDFAEQEATLAPRGAEKRRGGGADTGAAAAVQQHGGPRRHGGGGGARRGAPNTQGAGATQDITFEDEPVQSHIFLLNGRRPYDVIQDYVSAMTHALQQMKDAELGAIQGFMIRMSFSNMSEAQPDYLGELFKHVCKEGWDHAVSGLADLVGGGIAGSVVSEAIAIGEAMHDEMERAAAAQRSASTADFVEGVRTQTTSAFEGRIMQMATYGPALNGEYRGLEGDEGDNVTGAKAQFLTGLNNATRRIPRALPSQTSYEAKFIARYVNHGGGAILARFTSEDKGGGQFEFEQESVELKDCQNAGHAADVLTHVMRSGKRLWQLGVPLTVELQGPRPAGGEGWTGYVVEASGPDASRGTGFETMDARWRSFCQHHVLGGVGRISG